MYNNDMTMKVHIFHKLLNIISINTLYTIMIIIKRHKYIIDESIIISIRDIELYDADDMSDDPDTFEYKKCITYYNLYPYDQNEILNNRQYGTKNILLYIQNDKYLNLANCCNYF